MKAVVLPPDRRLGPAGVDAGGNAGVEGGGNAGAGGAGDGYPVAWDGVVRGGAAKTVSSVRQESAAGSGGGYAAAGIGSSRVASTASGGAVTGAVVGCASSIGWTYVSSIGWTAGNSVPHPAQKRLSPARGRPHFLQKPMIACLSVCAAVDTFTPSGRLGSRSYRRPGAISFE
jgi:hypothetical protein